MIYLICPYNHHDPRIRQERFLTANKIAATRFKLGNFVFSPISHTHPIAEAGSLELGFSKWKTFDLFMLDKCDEVMVIKIDGWEESVGVQAEIAYAKLRGKPIYYCNSEGIIIKTRDKLIKSLKTKIRSELYEIWIQADQIVLEDEDTLGDDFQLAAAIVSVFEKFAEGKLRGEPDEM